MWTNIGHSQIWESMGQTKEVRSDQCWAWLQNEDLKRETESPIVVAQNQSMKNKSSQSKG